MCDLCKSLNLYTLFTLINEILLLNNQKIIQSMLFVNIQYFLRCYVGNIYGTLLYAIIFNSIMMQGKGREATAEKKKK